MHVQWFVWKHTVRGGFPPLTPERVLFILLSACAAIPPSRVSKQRRSSASGDAPLVPHWPNCAAVLIHAAPSACLAFRSEAEQRELGSIALLKPNERTANAINAVSLMKCTQSASDQQWEAERSVSKAGTLLCLFRHLQIKILLLQAHINTAK